MTTAAVSHRAAGARGGYSFRTVAQMEWHKLRTVRSTWLIVGSFVVTTIGLGILILSHENYAHLGAADRAVFDPTHDSFISLVLGQLLTGTLGVLAVTSEFSTGLIRVTFAAVPSRQLVLTAKAAVIGAVMLVIGELTAFVTFVAGEAVLQAPAPHASLGQPGVLRAVLAGGAYPAIVALLGLGIGAIIRHTAGAICALVGLLFVLPLLSVTPALQNVSVNFAPHTMQNSLTAVRPFPHSFPAGALFALLCVYAVAAIAAGGWALARRDA